MVLSSHQQNPSHLQDLQDSTSITPRRSRHGHITIWRFNHPCLMCPCLQDQQKRLREKQRRNQEKLQHFLPGYFRPRGRWITHPIQSRMTRVSFDQELIWSICFLKKVSLTSLFRPLSSNQSDHHHHHNKSKEHRDSNSGTRSRANSNSCLSSPKPSSNINTPPVLQGMDTSFHMDVPWFIHGSSI